MLRLPACRCRPAFTRFFFPDWCSGFFAVHSTQLPKFCGFKGAHGNFWHRIADFIRHVGETNVPSVVLGLAALALLILGKRFLPNRPVALFIVIGGIAATSLMNLGSYGIKLL